MKFSTSFLFGLLCGMQHVIADSAIESSTSVCKTQYGSTSVGKLPTQVSSYSSAITSTSTYTSTPIVKVTPEPVTITKIQRSKEIVTTTRSPSKDWTSTLTTTQIQTITAPAVTSTETEISTTSVSTTTTYTFIQRVDPVQDTLKGASLKMAKRSRVMGRQSSENAGLTISGKYPQSVECDTTIFKIIISKVKKVALPKTVTLRPSKVIQTVTSVYTSTSTVCPPNPYNTITVTSTETAFTTMYPTVTTTTTLLATETAAIEFIPTFPQCGARNQASKINGRPIAFVSWDTETNVINQAIKAGTTAEQCCIDCILTPLCAVSLFAVNPGQGNNYCALISRADEVCSASEAVPVTVYSANSPLIPGQSATISNSKCGQYVNVVEL